MVKKIIAIVVPVNVINVLLKIPSLTIVFNANYLG